MLVMIMDDVMSNLRTDCEENVMRFSVRWIQNTINNDNDVYKQATGKVNNYPSQLGVNKMTPGMERLKTRRGKGRGGVTSREGTSRSAADCCLRERWKSIRL